MESEKTQVSTVAMERKDMYYRYFEFASHIRGGHVEAHWLDDRNSFWYAEGAPDQTIIYRVDPQGNTKTLLFDTCRLRHSLTSALGYEPPYGGLPFHDFEFVNDASAIEFRVENRAFLCELASYSITPLPPESEEEKDRRTLRLVRKAERPTRPDVMEIRSPDGSWFAGEKEHNISLRSTFDGREVALTTDAVQDYGWDVQDAQWSPDSLKVAVKKIDRRDVLRVPIVHWLKPMEEVEWVPYTKSGGPMPQMELYIVDILSKRQVRVDPGEGLDQKLYQAAWRPDGSELLFYRIDREHKKLDLMAADPVTGQTRVILSEEQDTFVTGYVLHAKDLDAQFLTLLKDDRHLIWRSERDGWAHLYLYDLQGNLLRRLTQGNFPVVRVVTVDEKAGWVYFTAHPAERPYDIHLYRVDIEAKGFARLTEGEGQHQVHFSPSKAFFLDTHFSLARPPATELRRADGELLQTLSVADVGALEALKWQPPEEFVVKAADGETDLYGVLYKPFDFDPSKQYPLIENIYGGPQIAWAPQAPHAFTADPPISTYVEMAQALPQLGFIVVMLDARGTPERGKAFQDVVYGDFGRNEIPDHVAALQQLAQERPYIDAKRVGIFGGSWGGYFTLRAMLLAPEVYKVGIATYPVADLYDHQFGAIEPYMGLPQNNWEGYEYGSSLRLADQLKGKLLIIHGTSDLNATFSATMKMVEALTRAGKPYDLIVLPEQDHHFTGASKRYWRDSTRRYFEEHLKP